MKKIWLILINMVFLCHNCTIFTCIMWSGVQEVIGTWLRTPNCKKINKALWVRVIVICIGRKLLWLDSDKGVVRGSTLSESILHFIAIIVINIIPKIYWLNNFCQICVSLFQPVCDTESPLLFATICNCSFNVKKGKKGEKWGKR